jgi:selenocysteine-specific elongation factor
MHILSKNKDSGNSCIFAQIHLNKPAILIPNDRFIIRNSSGNKTEGGGYVIDSSPLHHRKVTPALLTNLTILKNSLSDKKRICNLIQYELKKEIQPLSVEEIAKKLYVSIEDIKNELKKSDEVIKYENNDDVIVIYKGNDILFRNKIINILSHYHNANYLFAEGLKTNEFVGKLGQSNSSLFEKYINLLLPEMKKSGLIKQVNNTWAKSEYTPQIDEKTKKQIQWLENEILNYDLQKPVVSEIEKKSMESGVSANILRILFSYLVSERKIYMFNSEVVHMLVVSKHKKIILNELLENEKDGLDSEEFRKQTGLSKRLYPILLSIYEKEKLISIKNSGYKNQLFITKDGHELITRNQV